MTTDDTNNPNKKVSDILYEEIESIDIDPNKSDYTRAIWTAIIKVAEEDVKKENERNRGTRYRLFSSMEGIEKIAKLVEHIAGKDENLDPKKLKDNETVKELYTSLKEEVNKVRVFGVGKTSSEKLFGVARAAGRLVGAAVAAAAAVTGVAFNAAGYAVKFVPVVGAVLDRLPGLSKKTYTFDEKVKRQNMFELIADSFMEGAIYAKKQSLTPIAANLTRNLPEKVLNEIKLNSQKISSYLNRTESILPINLNTKKDKGRKV